jgi:hypothetical protein
MSRIVDKVTHEIRYFLLRRLPTCQALVPVMSESLERPLTLRERVVLKVHLWICVWCEWYLRQLHELRAASRALGAREQRGEDMPGPGLSDDARERIRRALEREQP